MLNMFMFTLEVKLKDEKAIMIFERKDKKK
jgi:hypothetical protein